jgi:hypothetical protein
VNIIAIVGGKGRNYFSCDTTTGDNVVFATFDPSEQVMYAAWESGEGASWKPAACGSYMKMDMKQWW